MALEDLAMFRAIPTCTVFYPSDGVSTERAVELAANTKVGQGSTGPDLTLVTWSKTTSPLFQGICFIRTSRPDTQVIYSPNEKFNVGEAKVIICFAS